MSRLLMVLVSAAFVVSISPVTGLAAPAQADEVPALCYEGLEDSVGEGRPSPDQAAISPPFMLRPMPKSEPICAEGTASLCESTCGEDHGEGVQITEVCSRFNGQVSCTCCCYYDYNYELN